MRNSDTVILAYGRPTKLRDAYLLTYMPLYLPTDWLHKLNNPTYPPISFGLIWYKRMKYARSKIFSHCLKRRLFPLKLSTWPPCGAVLVVECTLIWGSNSSIQMTASTECSWYLSSSMGVCHYSYEGFVRKCFAPLLCRWGKLWVNTAATVSFFSCFFLARNIYCNTLIGWSVL